MTTRAIQVDQGVGNKEKRLKPKFQNAGMKRCTARSIRDSSTGLEEKGYVRLIPNRPWRYMRLYMRIASVGWSLRDQPWIMRFQKGNVGRWICWKRWWALRMVEGESA